MDSSTGTNSVYIVVNFHLRGERKMKGFRVHLAVTLAGGLEEVATPLVRTSTLF